MAIENIIFKNPAGSLIDLKNNQSKGIGLPIVTTGNVNSDKSGIVSCSGHISSDVLPKATEKGICWSTSQNPVTGKDNVSCSTDCTGSEDFTCSVTGLQPSTIYYFRAYAANMIGTGYGKDVLYSTSPVKYPVVSSIEIASFTTTTVSFNINISSDGGYPLTAKGICWNRSSAPQIEAGDRKTDNGKGTGNFSSKIEGLTPGGIYCVRAYASNAVKTAYSEEIYIIMPTLPIVITDNDISDITSTGASCPRRCNR